MSKTNLSFEKLLALMEAFDADLLEEEIDFGDVVAYDPVNDVGGSFVSDQEAGSNPEWYKTDRQDPWMLSVSPTGRLGGRSEPQLQNIPVRTKEGAEIRRMLRKRGEQS
jgi:hypothetical protein